MEFRATFLYFFLAVLKMKIRTKEHIVAMRMVRFLTSVHPQEKYSNRWQLFDSNNERVKFIRRLSRYLHLLKNKHKNENPIIPTNLYTDSRNERSIRTLATGTNEYQEVAHVSIPYTGWKHSRHTQTCSSPTSAINKRPDTPADSSQHHSMLMKTQNNVIKRAQINTIVPSKMVNEHKSEHVTP